MGEEAGLKSPPPDQVMVADLETPGHFQLKTKDKGERKWDRFATLFASFVMTNGGTLVFGTIRLGIPDTQGQ